MKFFLFFVDFGDVIRVSLSVVDKNCEAARSGLTKLSLASDKFDGT